MYLSLVREDYNAVFPFTIKTIHTFNKCTKYCNITSHYILLIIFLINIKICFLQVNAEDAVSVFDM